jgi:uncharacterized membrane protein YdbT with pleckstrin-like domain
VAFPDDLLTDGEALLVHQRPHAKLLLLPALSFIGICGLSGYLAALLHRATWWGVGAPVLAGLAAVLAVWFAVVPLIRWFTTHFVVTDRRVLVREGVLTREGFEIPVARIDGVHYRQGLVDRLFGCGTLSIESGSAASPSDDGAVRFDDIPKVEKVYLTLREVTGAD